MIRVEYIYIKKDNTPIRHVAKFFTVNSAVRFMYKCARSKNMVYTGDFTCDDSEEVFEINRRFRWKEENTIPKRETKRVTITMDTRLILACDKYLDKVQQAGISSLTTRSQLIEQALLFYFDELARQNESLTKGEDRNEN